MAGHVPLFGPPGTPPHGRATINQPSLVGFDRFPRRHHYQSAQFICAIYFYAPFLYAPFMNRENNAYCFYMAIGDMQGRTSDRRDRLPGRHLVDLRNVAMSEAEMIIMALMLFVIVVSYLLMLGLVKFAEGVIDKALPARLRDAVPSDSNANARSL
jgi:hypothetical protein